MFSLDNNKRELVDIVVFINVHLLCFLLFKGLKHYVMLWAVGKVQNDKIMSNISVHMVPIHNNKLGSIQWNLWTLHTISIVRTWSLGTIKFPSYKGI